jgi:5-methylcytosine-specific restriction endonuclease McrA
MNYINCYICNKKILKTGHRQKYCEDCASKKIREYDKARRLANPEKAREFVNNWNKRNKNRLKEYHKKYYQENKNRLKANAKKYRQGNREVILVKKRKYWKENAFRLRAKCRLWRRENKDIMIKYKKDYHDLKKFDGNRFKALERDDYTCQICGDTEKEKLIVHHKNKSNELTELITLCRGCHQTIHGLMRIYKKMGNINISYEEIISKFL